MAGVTGVLSAPGSVCVTPPAPGLRPHEHTCLGIDRQLPRGTGGCSPAPRGPPARAALYHGPASTEAGAWLRVPAARAGEAAGPGSRIE